jgi:hypothetical protein
MKAERSFEAGSRGNAMSKKKKKKKKKTTTAPSYHHGKQHRTSNFQHFFVTRQPAMDKGAAPRGFSKTSRAFRVPR